MTQEEEEAGKGKEERGGLPAGTSLNRQVVEVWVK